MTNDEIACEVRWACLRVQASAVFPAGAARRVFSTLLLLLEDSIRYYGHDQFELSLKEIATFSRLLADNAGDTVEWKIPESVRQAYYKSRSAFPITKTHGAKRIVLRIELLPTERMLFAANMWVESAELGEFRVQPTPDVIGARIHGAEIYAIASATSGKLRDNTIIHAGRLAIAAALFGTPVPVVANHPYTFGAAMDDLTIDWQDGTGMKRVRQGRLIRHIFPKTAGTFSPRFRWRRETVWRESSVQLTVVPASASANEELRFTIREERQATRRNRRTRAREETE